MYEIGIEHGLVYMEGRFACLNLYIHDGKIALISSDEFACEKKIDGRGKHILPGFIDPHVHFDLGVKEQVNKDNFLSGSIEAIKGGVTTIIDFLDPVKTGEELIEAFSRRMEQAKDCKIDYGMHATIANPTDHPQKLVTAAKSVGISSIKLFTTYEESHRRTYDDYIYSLFEVTVGTEFKILIHAENDRLIDKQEGILVQNLEDSRPAITESIEVLKLAQMVRQTGGNLYIVHVSAGSSVSMLRENFEAELQAENIILESCPHYFLLNKNVLRRPDGYKYTMTPPLRDESERQLLCQLKNEIRVIGTDHCPYTREQKQHRYISEIPMGIGGIAYSFLNMYELFGFSIVDRFTKEPARIHKLKHKGVLLPGFDADLVIFDSKQTTFVEDEMSVYDGSEKQGKIEMVISRGKILMENGELTDCEESGKYLSRGKNDV